MRMKALKPIVEEILKQDEEARDDDHYLYCKVIEKINPAFLNTPFIVAFTNKNLPRFESVRRTRQKVQSEVPSLMASADVEAARMIKEEEYFEFAVHG